MKKKVEKVMSKDCVQVELAAIELSDCIERLDRFILAPEFFTEAYLDSISDSMLSIHESLMALVIKDMEGKK
jgi:hypothetical protein